jgi:hypothetical protein
MSDFLPGFQVNTIDGKLPGQRNPDAKRVLIFGTAGQGLADQPYQVLDRAVAAKVFGFNGTLVRAMEEVAPYCDNIILFRMGTAPGKVTGIGKDTTAEATAEGFDVVLNGDRSADTGKNYRVYYKDGVLAVFHSEALVYSNDPNNLVDLTDVSVTGSSGTGKGLAIGTAATWEGAVALEALKDLENATATEPLPVYTAAVDGLGMTVRETYVAQEKAMDLSEMYTVDQVYVPNCVIDAKSVALGADPAADPDALDWLKISEASDGHMVYHWASEAKDSDGTAVEAHEVWTTAAERTGDGYREVNFGYQLAAFCAKQSKIKANAGGTLGFIGTSGPKSWNIADIRAWVGKLPTKDPVTGAVTVTGKGLLGIPCLAGAAPGSLNALCHDKAAGRTRGFFENVAWAYDGGAASDANQRPIDIGAYVHVVGAWDILQNGYGNYTGNLAGLICGFVARLDDKSSPSNKDLVGVTLKWRFNTVQLEALASLGINMLKFVDWGALPRIAHGYTAASHASDYDRLTRQRIKFRVIRTAARVADPFIGETSTDGLQLQAMQTALDKEFLQMKKDGYLSFCRFNVVSTEAMQKIGHVNLNITFGPAEETVKLNITVGCGRK